MKKKFLAVLTIALLTACLTACSVTEHGYYDDNDAILAHSDDYSLIMASSTGLPTKSTLEASQFDGCKKVATLDVAQRPTLDLSLKIASGRLKLVAVNAEDEIFVVAELGAEQSEIASPVETTLPAGEYRFILVAEVAEEVEFRFEYPSEQ